MLYKALDDRAPYLAALVTYYAFVPLFPPTLLFASVAGFLLQSDHHLRGGALYGVVGVVLATLAYVYVEALFRMMSAEINVVLERRLWPRALLTPFTDDVELTAADEEVYASYVRTAPMAVDPHRLHGGVQSHPG